MQLPGAAGHAKLKLLIEYGGEACALVTKSFGGANLTRTHKLLYVFDSVHLVIGALGAQI